MSPRGGCISATSQEALRSLGDLEPIPNGLFFHQGGDRVEQTDGPRQARMGLPLNLGGGLEPAPPVDELSDQGPRRNPAKCDARKSLQSERRFHGSKAIRDIDGVRRA